MYHYLIRINQESFFGGEEKSSSDEGTSGEKDASSKSKVCAQNGEEKDDESTI